MAAKMFYLLAFIVAVHSASALTCYKCDSSQSTLCPYGLTSFTFPTVDCNQELGGGLIGSFIPKSCVKIIGKDKNDKEFVARTCMPQVGSSVCTAIAKSAAVFTNVEHEIVDSQCYTCDGDKCNSAHRFTGYTFIGVALAAVAFLL